MVSKVLSTFIGDAMLSCDVASLYLLDENFLTYHSSPAPTRLPIHPPQPWFPSLNS